MTLAGDDIPEHQRYVYGVYRGEMHRARVLRIMRYGSDAAQVYVQHRNWATEYHSSVSFARANFTIEAAVKAEQDSLIRNIASAEARLQNLRTELARTEWARATGTGWQE